MHLSLLLTVDHVIDHCSHYIILLNTFELCALTSNDESVDEWVSTSVKELTWDTISGIWLEDTVFIALYSDFDVCGVGIEKAITLEMEADDIIGFLILNIRDG